MIARGSKSYVVNEKRLPKVYCSVTCVNQTEVQGYKSGGYLYSNNSVTMSHYDSHLLLIMTNIYGDALVVRWPKVPT